MDTITAEGKFLTFQIGSFQTISRESYFFIHNNHRHSSALCGNPLEFLPRENIFFSITTYLLLWLNKGFVGWRNESGQGASNQKFPNHRDNVR